MRIFLVAMGQKAPKWVTQGYQEYARRMPAGCRLSLLEIAAGKRTKGANLKRLIEQEGERMLAVLPKNALVVALDGRGHQWSSGQLATRLDGWMRVGRDVALLVGGPDGLAPMCIEQAQHVWSLSRLTLPHTLVRIVVAEQIYRAWSVLEHHPYHRE